MADPELVLGGGGRGLEGGEGGFVLLALPCFLSSVCVFFFIRNGWRGGGGVLGSPNHFSVHGI